MQKLRWRAALVLAIVAGAAFLIADRPARLGLDLQGGTQIVLEARDAPGRKADSDTLNRTLEVLRRRVDQLGVAEPSLQRSGDRRIIVELPGVADPEEAVAVSNASTGRSAPPRFQPRAEDGPPRMGASSLTGRYNVSRPTTGSHPTTRCATSVGPGQALIDRRMSAA